MASSSLQDALQRFSGELRGFTARISDSVSTLKRCVDSRPCAGGEWVAGLKREEEDAQRRRILRCVQCVAELSLRLHHRRQSIALTTR